MKTLLKKQTGAVTLFISVMLIVSITLVAILSGKTILTETKIAADNYRISQAVASANYAMDYGVNYFDNGGFDQIGAIDATTGAVIGDGTIDTIAELSLTSTDNAQTTYASISFHNDPDIGAGASQNFARLCLATGISPRLDVGTMVAIGWSDDREAIRTITQCIGTLEVVRNEGPKQPLVAQGQVMVTGNARIINRYTDVTVWSGGDVNIGSSSSMATYIKDSSVGTLTAAQLTEVPGNGAGAPNNTELNSNKNLGNGSDIIDDDPNLGNLSGLEFFENFFHFNRVRFKQQATDIGQVYNNISSADGKSGMIWIEGDAHMTGGTIGSMTSPVIIVVNGDLQSTGNSSIFGLLYVVGKYAVGGTINVVGSNIVEGSVAPINITAEAGGTTVAKAAAPIVTGHGTLNLVFWPAFGGGAGGNPTEGTAAVIAGSWRDW